MKLNYVGPLSSFAFNFKLRRYSTAEDVIAALRDRFPGMMPHNKANGGGGGGGRGGGGGSGGSGSNGDGGGSGGGSSGGGSNSGCNVGGGGGGGGSGGGSGGGGPTRGSNGGINGSGGGGGGGPGCPGCPPPTGGSTCPPGYRSAADSGAAASPDCLFIQGVNASAASATAPAIQPEYAAPDPLGAVHVPPTDASMPLLPTQSSRPTAGLAVEGRPTQPSSTAGLLAMIRRCRLNLTARINVGSAWN